MKTNDALNLQSQSPLFNKLPAELRHQIYVTDKSVLAALERTCKLVGFEADAVVKSKDICSDASAWSKVRKLHYGNIAMPRLPEQTTAKTICKMANDAWNHPIAKVRREIARTEKEIIELGKSISECRGEDRAYDLVILHMELQGKMQKLSTLLQTVEREEDNLAQTFQAAMDTLSDS
jgi:hypothetical protein